MKEKYFLLGPVLIGTYGAGVESSPLTCIGLLYQPWIIDNDDDDCGAIGGMNDCQGKPNF
jgi:hypothetical protein